jgi:hypothetical protein
MDTTALRSAYDRLFDAAALPDLGDAADGGWDADHILAHLLSVDAAIAAAALGIVSGSRPTFDNRITLDAWNLDRIIAEHSGRAALIAHVRSQATILCDIAEQLSGEATSVLVPSLLLSNDALVVDQPIPLAGLIDGLAENHVPVHTRQLLELRDTPGSTPSPG